MRLSKFYLTALLIPVVFVAGCSSSGFGKTVKFKKPDIKDEFCGQHINFQFCKCAFHGEYCQEIGLDKKAAKAKVQSEYDKWVATELAAFQASCDAAGGISDNDACKYCKESYVAQGDACVSADAAEQTTAFVPDGPLTEECIVKTDEYDKDWKKYSDIDNAIPFEDRSYEAKQALIVYEDMVSKMLEAFSLERDIEVEKQAQADLEAYKAALVKNIKTNLMKSFWRLAWVTYSTIDSTKSLSGSYEKILDLDSYAEGIAASLKIIRSGVPSTSSLAIDTSDISGKVKSGGASVALDTVESLGDPVTVATTLFQEATNASLPSADITDEELAILKAQQLKNGLIDETLAKSRAANEARETRLAALDKEIPELQQKIDEWEGKEKTRVATELEESCKKLKTEASQ